MNALRPFQEFTRVGATSGVLLLVSTALALAWANSPWRDGYFRLWDAGLAIGVVRNPFSGTLRHWINDGLMSVFFLLMGLEIKRELLVGELSSPRQAALPIAAALGGMLIPALLYALVNARGAGAAGWGIPMATDIAFALGVLAILAARVPVGLKVFLTALAIVDDMGAVLVIAVFYTAAIQWISLGAAALAMAALVAFNAFGVRQLAPYLLVGVGLWLALLSSGVHATIAGVLLALTIPTRTEINAAEFSTRVRRLMDGFDRSETGDLLVLTSKGQQEAIHALRIASESVQGSLLRLEHALYGVVSYVIMPLFALANAGVALTGLGELLTSPVTLGAGLGLVVGKPLGILTFSWLATRTGLARLPERVSWQMLHGAAWLGGIGFTMSLFVADLAFGQGRMLDAAKAGVIVASTIAGVVGLLLVRRAASTITP
jgi:Na+:H+ antiporter, NhaA family